VANASVAELMASFCDNLLKKVRLPAAGAAARCGVRRRRVAASPIAKLVPCQPLGSSALCAVSCEPLLVARFIFYVQPHRTTFGL
jgi:hypothetical protein